MMAGAQQKQTPILAFFYLILELLGGHWLPLFITDGQAQLTKSLKSFFYDIAHDKACGAERSKKQKNDIFGLF